MPDRALRILIVAADALTRAGLAAILATQPGLQAVGQLQPTDDLDDALAIFQPDVQAGVRALIPRSAPAATLAAALHAAGANLVVLDTRAASSILVPATTIPDVFEPLTSREREVLQLMAQGMPNKSIARQLAISEHTVKFHVNAILSKFGAQSRTEAVVLASRAGLILL